MFWLAWQLLGVVIVVVAIALVIVIIGVAIEAWDVLSRLWRK